MTGLYDICHWLYHTSLATSIRESTLAFPIIEGTHVLGLAISVGIIMFLDFRFLRFAFRDVPVSRLMRQVGPWMITGIAVMFITGFLLFFAEAEKAYTNTFFRVKIALLILAGVNALIYQLKYFPRMAEWDTSDSIPVGVKAIAWLSLIFWFVIIICGRTMAYEI